MIIFKIYKGSYNNTTYAAYKRKSFRVEGKVKKKDIYLFTLKESDIANKTYLDWDKIDYDLERKVISISIQDIEKFKQQGYSIEKYKEMYYYWDYVKVFNEKLFQRKLLFMEYPTLMKELTEVIDRIPQKIKAREERKEESEKQFLEHLYSQGFESEMEWKICALGVVKGYWQDKEEYFRYKRLKEKNNLPTTRLFEIEKFIPMQTLENGFICKLEEEIYLDGHVNNLWNNKEEFDRIVEISDNNLPNTLSKQEKILNLFRVAYKEKRIVVTDEYIMKKYKYFI